MDSHKKENSKSKKKSLKNPARNKQTTYIYDNKTKQWKIWQQSGSLNYNHLSRDEWGWLD